MGSLCADEDVPCVRTGTEMQLLLHSCQLLVGMDFFLLFAITKSLFDNEHIGGIPRRC